MSGVSERETEIRASVDAGWAWSPVPFPGETEIRDLLALLDAERERVRVLAAAVPNEPYYQDGMAVYCLWCDRGAGLDRTHRPTCPWPAAHAIKESLSHE